MAITVTPSPLLPSSPHPHPDTDLSVRLGAATVPVSPTLAANETMDARRRRGEPVLPLGFGEAGLPAHRMLRAALARATGFNSYGPVAGHAALREAAACYWAKRGLPTDAEAVICGPGSKALLFGLMAAIGGDVAGGRLRLRVATSLLYGDTDTERTAALNAADPCSLPWVAASLARLEEVLADLVG